MNIVNYTEYSNDLDKFIKKHSKKSDLHIWTSPIENGEYRKEYLFEDGASFYEINKMNYSEQTEIEIHGIWVMVEVNMIKHEYFSTDEGISKYWYEKA